MVRITEEEYTDFDGQVRKVRKIEAAQARIAYPDGTVEEYSDATATEWPWTPEDSPPEWHLFGISPKRLLEQGLCWNDVLISLLSENGEVILKVGSIAIGITMSVNSTVYLAAKEIQLDG